jgi:hypothetical protein
MLHLDVFNMHVKDRSSLAYARKGVMTVSGTWMRVRNAHYVARIHLKLISVQTTVAAAWKGKGFLCEEQKHRTDLTRRLCARA